MLLSKKVCISFVFIWRTLVGVSFALTTLSCDEEMPARNDPAVVLIPGIKISTTDVVIRGNILIGGGDITITATNVHNEVLSEQVRLVGVVHILFLGAVSTLIYEERDLQTPSMLSGNTLTILPRDTLKLFRQCPHKADDDKPFWQMVEFHRMVTDRGEVYYQSDTAWIDISGTLQLFYRVQPMKLPSMRVPIVYKIG